ncbi:MAG: glycosyltransferase [Methylohalobius sp.]|nr:glycosyltransferase [Methylohalobius sp.]
MKPHVLIVISDLGPGGAQPMNLRLARHLKGRDYPVRVVTLFKRSWFEPLDASDLDLVRLGAKGVSKPLVALRLVPLARQADVVIGGMEDASTNYGWLAARLARKPFIAWTHIAFEQHLQRQGWLDRWLSLRVRRHVRWTVFPAQGTLDSMRRALGKQPPDSTWQVIENFLDPMPEPAPRAPDPKLFAKPVLMGIGRLAEQKGFERLIRAHAALRAQGLDHHLVILGEGPKRQELEAEIGRLDVQDTAFLPGQVSNVHDWLAHATVFALCSRYEGFALVLLEALACGVPCVAMDCPAGPREILEDGWAGLLTPDGDELAFQEALAKLFTDADLRSLYALRGKERARHYSPERIVPMWERLLERVASAAKGA